MKFATLMASPVIGGKVGSVDQSRALAIPGVRQVVVLDDLVAVVGDNTWAAMQGLDALAIEWAPGVHADLDQAQLWTDIEKSVRGCGRRRQEGGRRAGQAERGNAVRGNLRAALPRPCADGNDELHRARP